MLQSARRNSSDAAGIACSRTHGHDSSRQGRGARGQLRARLLGLSRPARGRVWALVAPRPRPIRGNRPPLPQAISAFSWIWLRTVTELQIRSKLVCYEIRRLVERPDVRLATRVVLEYIFNSVGSSPRRRRPAKGS